MRRTFCLLLVCLCVLAPTSAQDKKKPAPKAEPRVIFTLPLGVAPGKTTKLTIRGVSLDDASEVRILDGQGSVKILGKGKAPVPDKNPEKVGDTQIEVELKVSEKLKGDSLSLIVVTPTGETKPHAVLVETALPVVPEKEANDGFRAAQPIVVPTVVEGAIQRARDVDVFRIEGKKGQKLVAEVLASRHGSPLDGILTLYDAKGQQIASNDDFTSTHRDARLDVTLPTDGLFFLTLIDAHDTGSNLHVYRLVVR